MEILALVFTKTAKSKDSQQASPQASEDFIILQLALRSLRND